MGLNIENGTNARIGETIEEDTPSGHIICHLCVLLSGETEITDLEVTVGVHHNVAGFLGTPKPRQIKTPVIKKLVNTFVEVENWGKLKFRKKNWLTLNLLFL